MYELARVLVVVGAVVVVRPTAARAEEPVLDGHRFVPSSLVALVVVPRAVDGSFIAAAQTLWASLGSPGSSR